MICRAKPDQSLLIITQPAHAWLTGQFAEHWGNRRFPIPEPRGPLSLAAFRHDDGWAEWESAPRLRPDGRPPSFTEMPIDEHLAIWRRGLRRVGALDHFSALLVALHATALYRSRLANRADSPEVQVKIAAFQAEAEEMIRRWTYDLRADPAYAAVLPEELAPASYTPLRLLQVWDLLSLLVCGGLRQSRQVAEVPAAGGPVTLEIVPVSVDDGCDHVERFTVSPWPFCRGSFTLRTDARWLPQGQFADTIGFRAALQVAAWQSLSFSFEGA